MNPRIHRLKSVRLSELVLIDDFVAFYGVLGTAHREHDNMLARTMCVDGNILIRHPSTDRGLTLISEITFRLNFCKLLTKLTP